MANGSTESKDEDSLWPADGSAQSLSSSQYSQDLGTQGDSSDNFSQAEIYLPPPLHPHPPSPVSVAELQERAVQDSQNNNVDENSNDHHYDHYATAPIASAYPNQGDSSHLAYHDQGNLHYSSPYRDASSYPAYNNREVLNPSYSNRGSSSGLPWDTSHDGWRSSNLPFFNPESSSVHSYREVPHHSNLEVGSQSHSVSSHSTQNTSHSSDQSCPVQETVSVSDQSVRPRVRQLSQYKRDEPDHTLPSRLHAVPRRDSFSSSSCQHSGLAHRRNRSEGTTPATRYPPLPNHNCSHIESGREGVLLSFLNTDHFPVLLDNVLICHQN